MSRSTDTGPAQTPGTAEGSRRSRGGLVALTAAVAVLALAIGALLGSLVGRWNTPGDDSPEAGFARDMAVHHAQAVEMSLLLLERTDDEVMEPLARDIATTQAHQEGQMFAWLRMWDLPIAPPGEPMEWMAEHAGHADHGEDGSMLLEDGRMPGMASPQELEQLREADGEEAEILFLQIMTRHHIAGVDMAQAAVDLSANDHVLQLARTIVQGPTP